MDDTQFLKAERDAERDPNKAFRLVEQATLDLFSMTAGGFPGTKDRLAQLRHIVATSVDESVRGGLLRRLDWLQAAGLLYGIVKSDGPVTALQDLIRGDPDGKLLDQLPCTSFPRMTLAFLAAYGPWDERGPLPPGFPVPADPIPEDVNDWWDPRFLAAVCYRAFALGAVLEARPPGQQLASEDLTVVGGPLDELTSDRRGRVFMPWKVLLSRLWENNKTYDFDELREQLERQLDLPYPEIIGQPTSAK
jgi:hypothetical protein